MSLPSPSVPDAPLPVLGHVSAQWTPPDNSSVTLHTGDALPAGRLYFVGPPAEIGSVRSAYSNLDAQKGVSANMGKRLLNALGGFILGVLATAVLGAKIGLWDLLDASIIWLAIGGTVGGVIAFIRAKPKYETSYVGEKGIASFKYTTGKSMIDNADIFCFDRAATLKVAQTRNYYNGVYTGTTYSFVWSDVAGKPAYKITGTYSHKDGNPPAEDRYWYGVGAENAWSRYQLPVLRAKLAAGETVLFPVQGRGAVGVSPEGLVIQIGGKQETVPFVSIGNMGINNGNVTIARVGAKKGFLGIGADGVYQFAYSALGNARLFLALLAESASPQRNTVSSPSTTESTADADSPTPTGV